MYKLYPSWENGSEYENEPVLIVTNTPPVLADDVAAHIRPVFHWVAGQPTPVHHYWRRGAACLLPIRNATGLYHQCKCQNDREQFGLSGLN